MVLTKEDIISKTYNDFIKTKNPFTNESKENNLCKSILEKKYHEWCDKYWMDEVETLNYLLYNLHESYIEATYLYEKSEGNDLKMFLMLFAPYLLAVVLGIRISKVSAELVGFKEES